MNKNKIRRERKRKSKILRDWGKQDSKKPSFNEVRKYRKSLKKHLKDPFENPIKPKPLKGWYKEN